MVSSSDLDQNGSDFLLNLYSLVSDIFQLFMSLLSLINWKQPFFDLRTFNPLNPA